MSLTGYSYDQFNNIICFRKRHEKVFVLKDEIIMFSINGRKVDIHTVRGRHTINATLNDIENNLNDAGFLRIHQSYIINLKMIKAVKQKDGKRYIEFHHTDEIALISKNNEHKLYEMVKTI